MANYKSKLKRKIIQIVIKSHQIQINYQILKVNIRMKKLNYLSDLCILYNK